MAALTSSAMMTLTVARDERMSFIITIQHG
jgi:hypothetical protein